MKSLFENKKIQGVMAVVAYAVFSAFLLVPGDKIIGSAYFIVGAGGMFLTMLWFLKLWTGKQMLWAVLILAVLVRIGAIVQYPENSDIRRYVWEGKIQLSGYNPYLLAPDAKQLEHLRDDNWEELNFKEISAIYWPFAQTVFKAGAALSQSHWFFKAILVCFDLGTIWVLLMMLKGISSDYREIVLYALNPLTIISVAGQGHLESMLVFWIMMCLYGYWEKKPWLMYLALGLAVMTKPTPVIFLPLLVERDNLKYLPFFLMPFALMLIYASPGVNFFSSLDVFLSDFHFNGLFNYVCQTLFDWLPSPWVATGCAAGLSAFVFFFTPERSRSFFLLSTVLLIFAPTFHTWYLLLLTPFLVLYRPRPWILLHATILPMVFFFQTTESPLWHSKLYMQGIEFIPFILYGIWYFWKNRQYWPVRLPPVKSVSVIIRMASASQNVEGAIQSVEKGDWPIEIIVENGTSKKYPDLAETYPDVQWVSAPAGKERLIQHGMRTARNDVVVFLDADSRFLPGTLSRMMAMFRENESAAGGCLGDVSAESAAGEKTVRWVHRLWYLVSGIRFGTNGMFFKKEALRSLRDAPNDAFIQGIELSLCVKENGGAVYLPSALHPAARPLRRRMQGVFSLKAGYALIRYLMFRRLGITNGFSNEAGYAMPTDPAKKQAA